MNHNSTKRTNRNGLSFNRITWIICEQWPEIWPMVIDRQNKQLEHRRLLILAARNQPIKKAS